MEKHWDTDLRETISRIMKVKQDRQKAIDDKVKAINDKIETLNLELAAIRKQRVEMDLAGEDVTAIDKKIRVIRLDIEELTENKKGYEQVKVDFNKELETIRKAAIRAKGLRQQEISELSNEIKNIKEQILALEQQRDKLGTEMHFLLNFSLLETILPLELISTGLSNRHPVIKRTVLDMWLNGKDYEAYLAEEERQRKALYASSY